MYIIINVWLNILRSEKIKIEGSGTFNNFFILLKLKQIIFGGKNVQSTLKNPQI